MDDELLALVYAAQVRIFNLKAAQEKKRDDQQEGLPEAPWQVHHLPEHEPRRSSHAVPPPDCVEGRQVQVGLLWPKFGGEIPTISWRQSLVKRLRRLTILNSCDPVELIIFRFLCPPPDEETLDQFLAARDDPWGK